MRRLVAFLVLVGFFSPPAFASTNPSKFGLDWAHVENFQAYRSGNPNRVIGIGCRAYGEAIYLCSVKIKNIATGRIVCAYAAIGSSGQVLQSKTVKCADNVLAS